MTGRFSPAEGQTADSDYIDSVKDIVRDKLSYCKSVIEVNANYNIDECEQCGTKLDKADM